MNSGVKEKVKENYSRDVKQQSLEGQVNFDFERVKQKLGKIKNKEDLKEILVNLNRIGEKIESLENLMNERNKLMEATDKDIKLLQDKRLDIKDLTIIKKELHGIASKELQTISCNDLKKELDKIKVYSDTITKMGFNQKFFEKTAIVELDYDIDNILKLEFTETELPQIKTGIDENFGEFKKEIKKYYSPVKSLEDKDIKKSIEERKSLIKEYTPDTEEFERWKDEVKSEYEEFRQRTHKSCLDLLKDRSDERKGEAGKILGHFSHLEEFARLILEIDTSSVVFQKLISSMRLLVISTTIVKLYVNLL